MYLYSSLPFVAFVVKMASIGYSGGIPDLPQAGRSGRNIRDAATASKLSLTGILILLFVVILFVVVPMIVIYRNLNKAITTLNTSVTQLSNTEKKVDAFIDQGNTIINDVKKVESDVSSFKAAICNANIPLIGPTIKHDLGCPGY